MKKLTKKIVEKIEGQGKVKFTLVQPFESYDMYVTTLARKINSKKSENPDLVKEVFAKDHKGSVKNNLVEFAPEFAVDLIDLIEQNRRNSELFRGLLRLRIG